MSLKTFIEDGIEIVKDILYTDRDECPEEGNKYYTTKDYGGYSSCIEGNKGYLPVLWNGCVMPNCVGYAFGRFNEVGNYRKFKYHWSGNACKLIVNQQSAEDIAAKATSGTLTNGLKYGTTPALGAMIVWKYNEPDGQPGHVAIVERIDSSTEITVSESGWSFKTQYFSSKKFKKGASGNWRSDNSYYIFQGFIYSPKLVPTVLSALTNGKNYVQDSVQTAVQSVLPDFTVRTGDLKLAETTYQKIDQNALRGAQYNNIVQQSALSAGTTTRDLNLLSSLSLVESPFIIAKIGNYTFGSYTKSGTLENSKSRSTVDFPNYMDSLSIVKTSGQINQYTLNMVYQIEPGDDPNLLDRVFSSVANTRDITLSYGDWQLPSFIYKEESAIITNVTSTVDFANQRINYSLDCTSKALSRSSSSQDYTARSAKVSTLIKELLYSSNSGLLEVFPGMTNRAKVETAGLIPVDDKIVSVEAKSTSPLAYLEYLVSCMTAQTNVSDADGLNDSVYHLVIVDDTKNEFGGEYFKIVKIGAKANEDALTKVYEVDIGYPSTSTLVTSFSINENSEWSILYNAATAIQQKYYSYSIDDDGNVITTLKNNATSSAKYNKTTASSKNWWTQVTKHPISATLTIKGLLRPAILMEYIRINAYFYGQKHISSGLYTITRQEDTINAGGYTTTLTLQKISGDEDEFEYATTNLLR